VFDVLLSIDRRVLSSLLVRPAAEAGNDRVLQSSQRRVDDKRQRRRRRVAERVDGRDRQRVRIRRSE
jgi:hypothetical protein